MYLAQFHEAVKPVLALAPCTPSTSVPRGVSLKNYSKLAILISVQNGATITGCAVSLKQMTDVANANLDEKALAFTQMWVNLDTADTLTDLNTEPPVGDVLTLTPVVASTFTTLTTDALGLLYLIEVDSSMLDYSAGFDCVRVAIGDGGNNVVCIHYFLFPVSGNPAPVALGN